MLHSLLMILIIYDGNGITMFLDDMRENNLKRICLKRKAIPQIGKKIMNNLKYSPLTNKPKE